MYFPVEQLSVNTLLQGNWAILFHNRLNRACQSLSTCQKLQCLYENLMSNNFRKTAVLKKISVVNERQKTKDSTKKI